MALGVRTTIFGVYGRLTTLHQIGADVGKALERYDGKLDVIYDVGLNADNTAMYGQLIFWNETIRG